MKSGLKILLLLLAVHYGSFGFAQDATALINKVKA